MIIFIYGTDTFRSKIYLNKMVEKFKSDRDPSGYNVSILDVEKLEDTSKVIQEILSIPFLAERRLIVIKNLLASKLTDLKKEIVERIDKKTLPESNVIIFWEADGEFKEKDSKDLLSRLLKEKYKEQFVPLSPFELSAWAEREVKNRSGSISRAALSYLVQHAGADMWQMNNLVEELIAYKNGKEIEVKDVKEFVEEKADDNIFNLVEAIVGRQPKKVYKMIREQYKKGEDSQFIFIMLARQFKILLQMRDLFEREDNMQSEAIAKKLGMHPFVVKKSLPLVKRYSMRELVRIYKQLLDMDIKTKTGQGDQGVQLDILVGKICLG